MGAGNSKTLEEAGIESMKKRNWFLGILLIVIVVAGVFNKSKAAKSAVELAPTDAKPAYFASDQEQLDDLTDYPRILNAISAQPIKEEGMYVIPGLRNTETLNLANEQLDDCGMMTPQGVTVAGRYLLISAYCHDAKHHSVLYVLDRYSHEYLKTIVLKGRPHVGGIAYDPQTQKLWVCGEREQHAEIFAIDLARITSYQFSEASTYRPITYSDQFELPEIRRASTIAYHENSLYIGHFTDEGAGVLEQYELNERGELSGQLLRRAALSEDLTADLPESSVETVDRVQGITFYQDKLLLSQSLGAWQESKIYVFDDSQKPAAFQRQEALEVIEAPAHLEQITVIDQKLYAVFESAASAYVKLEATRVDRVLTLDVLTLLVDD